MTDEGRIATPILIAMVAIASVVGFLFLFPSSPLYYNPQASSSGIHLKGCLYDSSGNQIGCNSAFKVPIGQSVTGAGGASIASIRIPSAYATLNYTGTPTSISLTATEQASYAKGVGESFAVSYSSNSPVKSFNITLPKSSWTTSELQAKWGSSYGTKLVNITILNPTLTVKFANGITVTKPSAFNYQVQFTLNYGQSSVTSTTTATYSTTTTTQTSSTTTTISGGGVSSGTTDVWSTTITSASGGATGNTASNGIVATLAPDYYFSGTQSVVNLYLPSSISAGCSSGFFATVITPSQSVTVGRIPIDIGPWFRIAFSVQVTPNSPYLLQVTCAANGTYLFNQVVNASPAQPSNLPPPPYDTTQSQITTTTTTTTASSALCSATNTLQGGTTVYGYTAKQCLAMSVVSVSF